MNLFWSKRWRSSFFLVYYCQTPQTGRIYQLKVRLKFHILKGNLVWMFHSKSFVAVQYWAISSFGLVSFISYYMKGSYSMQFISFTFVQTGFWVIHARSPDSGDLAWKCVAILYLCYTPLFLDRAREEERKWEINFYIKPAVLAASCSSRSRFHPIILCLQLLLNGSRSKFLVIVMNQLKSRLSHITHNIFSLSICSSFVGPAQTVLKGDFFSGPPHKKLEYRIPC